MREMQRGKLRLRFGRQDVLKRMTAFRWQLGLTWYRYNLESGRFWRFCCSVAIVAVAIAVGVIVFGDCGDDFER